MARFIDKKIEKYPINLRKLCDKFALITHDTLTNRIKNFILLTCLQFTVIYVAMLCA